MSFSSPEITRVYLHRLLTEALPREAGEAYVNNVFNDIYTSVISNMNGTLTVDANMILSKYQPVVSMNDESGRRWKLFKEMIENLLTFNSADQIANYLAFLDSLNNNKSKEQQQQDIPTTRYNSMNHLQNPFLEPAAAQESSSFRSSSFTIGGKTLNQLIQPYYYDYKDIVKDEDILQFISYTLLGSTSTLFPFTEDGVIKLPSNINYSIGGFLFLLLEPALLYKTLITKFSNLKLKENLSQTKLAFVSEAMSTYLGGYAKLVNSIFNQQDLTLRKLHLYLSDEIIKLRFLNHLTLALSDPGSDFVSQLYKFSYHGDFLIKEMGQNLFVKSAIPYYDLVLEWITNGEVGHDNEQEFFVEFHSNGHDRSLKDYTFIAERIPSFFPSKIGSQIYQIGKTIVFLKYYSKELKWLNDYNHRYMTIINKHQGLMNMDKNKFAMLIETQYKEVVNYACSIIYGKFKLLDDIKGINDVLMRKGDLINSIIRQGFETLNEPSGSLSSHKLNRLLNDAIEDSSLKYYPTDTINKIDARMLNHGSIGFDSFTLDYRSSLPLIFDDSIKEYLRLFNFFFKIKRVSYMLSHVWLESTSFKDINSYVKKLKVSVKRGNHVVRSADINYIYAMNHLKKLNIVSSNMTKFINKISMFFNYEIIEKNYNKLMEIFESKDIKTKVKTDENGLKKLAKLTPNANYLARVNSSTLKTIPEAELITNPFNDLNIDEMIKYHEAYIKSISRNKLLDTKAISSKGKYSGTFFIHQLNNLVSMVYKFLMINEEFYINILELLNTLNTIEPDGDYIESLKKRMEMLNQSLYDILYKFKGCSDVFNNDLINDDDAQLKYFGHILSG